MSTATLERPTQTRVLDSISKFEEAKRRIDAIDLDVQDHSSFNATQGAARDNRIVLPINPYKMRVWYSVQQTIADNATVQVLFDTVTGAGTYDSTGSFSTSTSTYTVPVTGYYFISAKVGLVVPAVVNADPAAYSAVYVNAAQATEGTITKFRDFAGLGYAFGANVFDTLFLSAGDAVQIWTQVGGGGGNWKTRNGSDLTYWSMHLVSG